MAEEQALGTGGENPQAGGNETPKNIDFFATTNQNWAEQGQSFNPEKVLSDIYTAKEAGSNINWDDNETAWEKNKANPMFGGDKSLFDQQYEVVSQLHDAYKNKEFDTNYANKVTSTTQSYLENKGIRTASSDIFLAGGRGDKLARYNAGAERGGMQKYTTDQNYAGYSGKYYDQFGEKKNTGSKKYNPFHTLAVDYNNEGDPFLRELSKGENATDKEVVGIFGTQKMRGNAAVDTVANAWDSFVPGMVQDISRLFLIKQDLVNGLTKEATDWQSDGGTIFGTEFEQEEFLKYGNVPESLKRDYLDKYNKEELQEMWHQNGDHKARAALGVADYIERSRTEGFASIASEIEKFAANLKFNASQENLQGGFTGGDLGSFFTALGGGIGYILPQRAVGKIAVKGALALSKKALQATAKQYAKANKVGRYATSGYGTVQMMSMGYQSGIEAGIPKHHAALMAIAMSPFFFAAEKLVGTDYLSRMGSVTNDGLSSTLKGIYKKQFKAATGKDMTEEQIAKMAGEFGNKWFTKMKIAPSVYKASQSVKKTLGKMPGAEGAWTEGLQESTEEAMYIAGEGLYDTLVSDGAPAGEGAYGTKVWGEESIHRLKESFIGGFFIGGVMDFRTRNEAARTDTIKHYVSRGLGSELKAMAKEMNYDGTIDPDGTKSAEIQDLVEKEVARYEEVIKAAGIDRKELKDIYPEDSDIIYEYIGLVDRKRELDELVNKEGASEQEIEKTKQELKTVEYELQKAKDGITHREKAKEEVIYEQIRNNDPSPHESSQALRAFTDKFNSSVKPHQEELNEKARIADELFNTEGKTSLSEAVSSIENITLDDIDNVDTLAGLGKALSSIRQSFEKFGARGNPQEVQDKLNKKKAELVDQLLDSGKYQSGLPEEVLASFEGDAKIDAIMNEMSANPNATTDILNDIVKTSKFIGKGEAQDQAVSLEEAQRSSYTTYGPQLNDHESSMEDALDQIINSDSEQGDKQIQTLNEIERQLNVNEKVLEAVDGPYRKMSDGVAYYEYPNEAGEVQSLEEGNLSEETAALINEDLKRIREKLEKAAEIINESDIKRAGRQKDVMSSDIRLRHHFLATALKILGLDDPTFNRITEIVQGGRESIEENQPEIEKLIVDVEHYVSSKLKSKKQVKDLVEASRKQQQAYGNNQSYMFDDQFRSTSYEKLFTNEVLDKFLGVNGKESSIGFQTFLNFYAVNYFTNLKRSSPASFYAYKKLSLAKRNVKEGEKDTSDLFTGNTSSYEQEAIEKHIFSWFFDPVNSVAETDASMKVHKGIRDKLLPSTLVIQGYAGAGKTVHIVPEAFHAIAQKLKRNVKVHILSPGAEINTKIKNTLGDSVTIQGDNDFDAIGTSLDLTTLQDVDVLFIDEASALTAQQLDAIKQAQDARPKNKKIKILAIADSSQMSAIVDGKMISEPPILLRSEKTMPAGQVFRAGNPNIITVQSELRAAAHRAEESGGALRITMPNVSHDNDFKNGVFYAPKSTTVEGMVDLAMSQQGSLNVVDHVIITFTETERQKAIKHLVAFHKIGINEANGIVKYMEPGVDTGFGTERSIVYVAITENDEKGRALKRAWLTAASRANNFVALPSGGNSTAMENIESFSEQTPIDKDTNAVSYLNRIEPLGEQFEESPEETGEDEPMGPATWNQALQSLYEGKAKELEANTVGSAYNLRAFEAIEIRRQAEIYSIKTVNTAIGDAYASNSFKARNTLEEINKDIKDKYDKEVDDLKQPTQQDIKAIEDKWDKLIEAHNKLKPKPKKPSGGTGTGGGAGTNNGKRIYDNVMVYSQKLPGANIEVEAEVGNSYLKPGTKEEHILEAFYTVNGDRFVKMSGIDEGIPIIEMLSGWKLSPSIRDAGGVNEWHSELAAVKAAAAQGNPVPFTPNVHVRNQDHLNGKTFSWFFISTAGLSPNANADELLLEKAKQEGLRAQILGHFMQKNLGQIQDVFLLKHFKNLEIMDLGQDASGKNPEIKNWEDSTLITIKPSYLAKNSEEIFGKKYSEEEIKEMQLDIFSWLPQNFKNLKNTDLHNDLITLNQKGWKLGQKQKDVNETVIGPVDFMGMKAGFNPKNKDGGAQTGLTGLIQNLEAKGFEIMRDSNGDVIYEMHTAQWEDKNIDNQKWPSTQMFVRMKTNVPGTEIPWSSSTPVFIKTAVATSKNAFSPAIKQLTDLIKDKGDDISFQDLAFSDGLKLLNYNRSIIIPGLGTKEALMLAELEEHLVIRSKGLNFTLWGKTKPTGSSSEMRNRTESVLAALKAMEKLSKGTAASRTQPGNPAKKFYSLGKMSGSRILPSAINLPGKPIKNIFRLDPSSTDNWMTDTADVRKPTPQFNIRKALDNLKASNDQTSANTQQPPTPNRPGAPSIKRSMNTKGLKGANNYTITKRLARRHLIQVLGRKNADAALRFRKELRNETNESLYGQLNRGFIYLKEDENGLINPEAPKHEAMHYVLNYLMSPEAASQIYNEARSRMVSEGRVPGTITDLHAEEYLARLYGERYQASGNRFLDSRVGRWIKWLGNAVTRWFQNKDRIDDLMWKVETGGFRGTVPRTNQLDAIRDMRDPSPEGPIRPDRSGNDAYSGNDMIRDFGNIPNFKYRAQELGSELMNSSRYSTDKDNARNIETLQATLFRVRNVYLKWHEYDKDNGFLNDNGQKEWKLVNGKQIWNWDEITTEDIEHLSDQDYSLYTTYLLGTEKIFKAAINEILPGVKLSSFLDMSSFVEDNQAIADMKLKGSMESLDDVIDIESLLDGPEKQQTLSDQIENNDMVNPLQRMGPIIKWHLLALKDRNNTPINAGVLMKELAEIGANSNLPNNSLGTINSRNVVDMFQKNLYSRMMETQPLEDDKPSDVFLALEAFSSKYFFFNPNISNDIRLPGVSYWELVNNDKELEYNELTREETIKNMMNTGQVGDEQSQESNTYYTEEQIAKYEADTESNVAIRKEAFASEMISAMVGTFISMSPSVYVKYKIEEVDYGGDVGKGVRVEPVYHIGGSTELEKTRIEDAILAGFVVTDNSTEYRQTIRDRFNIDNENDQRRGYSKIKIRNTGVSASNGEMIVEAIKNKDGKIINWKMSDAAKENSDLVKTFFSSMEVFLNDDAINYFLSNADPNNGIDDLANIIGDYSVLMHDSISQIEKSPIDPILNERRSNLYDNEEIDTQSINQRLGDTGVGINSVLTPASLYRYNQQLAAVSSMVNGGDHVRRYYGVDGNARHLDVLGSTIKQMLTSNYTAGQNSSDSLESSPDIVATEDPAAINNDNRIFNPFLDAGSNYKIYRVANEDGIESFNRETRISEGSANTLDYYEVKFKGFAAEIEKNRKDQILDLPGHQLSDKKQLTFRVKFNEKVSSGDPRYMRLVNGKWEPNPSVVTDLFDRAIGYFANAQNVSFNKWKALDITFFEKNEYLSGVENPGAIETYLLKQDGLSQDEQETFTRQIERSNLVINRDYKVNPETRVVSIGNATAFDSKTHAMFNKNNLAAFKSAENKYEFVKGLFKEEIDRQEALKPSLFKDKRGLAEGFNMAFTFNDVFTSQLAQGTHLDHNGYEDYLKRGAGPIAPGHRLVTGLKNGVPNRSKIVILQDVKEANNIAKDAGIVNRTDGWAIGNPIFRRLIVNSTGGNMGYMNNGISKMVYAKGGLYLKYSINWITEDQFNKSQTVKDNFYKMFPKSMHSTFDAFKTRDGFDAAIDNMALLISKEPGLKEQITSHAIFQSAVKTGANKINDIKDEAWETQEIDSNYWRIQLNPDQDFTDTKIKSPTQVLAQMGVLGHNVELMTKVNSIQSKIVDIALDKINQAINKHNDLGMRNAIHEFSRKLLIEATKKSSDNDAVSEYLNDTSMSMDHPALSAKAKATIANMITNQAINFYMNGQRYNQAPGFFLREEGDRLKGPSINDAGEYVPGEVIMPFSYISMFGLDAKGIAEMSIPDIRALIQKNKDETAAKAFDQLTKVYMGRVPSAAPSSGFVMNVVGFVNDNSNAVYIPSEVNWLNGADYDIDQLSVYFPKPELNANNEITIDRSDSEVGLKNQLLDSIFDYYSDPRNADLAMKPTGPDLITGTKMPIASENLKMTQDQVYEIEGLLEQIQEVRARAETAMYTLEGKAAFALASMPLDPESVKRETKLRIGIGSNYDINPGWFVSRGKKRFTINEVAKSVWEDNLSEEGGNVEESDVRNVVIEMVSSFDNAGQVDKAYLQVDQELLNQLESDLEAVYEDARPTVKQFTSSKIEPYERQPYSFVSHLKYREIISEGSRMVGVFANAIKAVSFLSHAKSVLNSTGGPTLGPMLADAAFTSRNRPVPQNILPLNGKWVEGENTEPYVIEVLSAFLNSALDNAKETVLGAIGARVISADMIAAMVIKGRTVPQIVEMLSHPILVNAVNKTIKADGMYYDTPTTLNAYGKKRTLYDSLYETLETGSDEDGANVFELLEYWALGEQLSRTNDIIGLNTKGIPHDSYGMQNAVNKIQNTLNQDIESFLKNGPKKSGEIADFDKDYWLKTHFYAGNPNDTGSEAFYMVQKELFIRQSFDLPAAINVMENAKGYLKALVETEKIFAQGFVESSPAFVKIKNDLHRRLKINGLISKQSYKEFSKEVSRLIESMFIEERLSKIIIRSERQNVGDIDISTPAGRYDYGMEMIDWWERVRNTTPNTNSFLEGVVVKSNKDGAYLGFSHDLTNMSDLAKLQMRRDFEKIDDIIGENAMQRFYIYQMVRNGTRYGKDSFSEFMPSHMHKEYSNWIEGKFKDFMYDERHLSNEALLEDEKAPSITIGGKELTIEDISDALINDIGHYTSSLIPKRTNIYKSSKLSNTPVRQGDKLAVSASLKLPIKPEAPDFFRGSSLYAGSAVVVQRKATESEIAQGLQTEVGGIVIKGKHSNAFNPYVVGASESVGEDVAVFKKITDKQHKIVQKGGELTLIVIREGQFYKAVVAGRDAQVLNYGESEEGVDTMTLSVEGYSQKETDPSIRPSEPLKKYLPTELRDQTEVSYLDPAEYGNLNKDELKLISKNYDSLKEAKEAAKEMNLLRLSQSDSTIKFVADSVAKNKFDKSKKKYNINIEINPGKASVKTKTRMLDQIIGSSKLSENKMGLVASWLKDNYPEAAKGKVLFVNRKGNKWFEAKGNEDLHAYFDLETGNIVMDIEAVKSGGPRALEHLFLHELVHNATEGAFQAVEQGRASDVEQKFVDDIKTLHEKVKADSPGLINQYNVSDIREFVSESLSNVKFQTELAKIGPVDKKFTYWSSIVQAFRGWLKAMTGDSVDANILDQVLGVAGSYIAENGFSQWDQTEGIRKYQMKFWGNKSASKANKGEDLDFGEINDIKDIKSYLMHRDVAKSGLDIGEMSLENMVDEIFNKMNKDSMIFFGGTGRLHNIGKELNIKSVTPANAEMVKEHIRRNIAPNYIDLDITVKERFIEALETSLESADPEATMRDLIEEDVMLGSRFKSQLAMALVRQVEHVEGAEYVLLSHVVKSERLQKKYGIKLDKAFIGQDPMLQIYTDSAGKQNVSIIDITKSFLGGTGVNNEGGNILSNFYDRQSVPLSKGANMINSEGDVRNLMAGMTAMSMASSNPDLRFGKIGVISLSSGNINSQYQDMNRVIGVVKVMKNTPVLWNKLPDNIKNVLSDKLALEGDYNRDAISTYYQWLMNNPQLHEEGTATIRQTIGDEIERYTNSGNNKVLLEALRNRETMIRNNAQDPGSLMQGVTQESKEYLYVSESIHQLNQAKMSGKNESRDTSVVGRFIKNMFDLEDDVIQNFRNKMVQAEKLIVRLTNQYKKEQNSYIDAIDEAYWNEAKANPITNKLLDVGADRFNRMWVKKEMQVGDTNEMHLANTGYVFWTTSEEEDPLNGREAAEKLRNGDITQAELDYGRFLVDKIEEKYIKIEMHLSDSSYIVDGQWNKKQSYEDAKEAVSTKWTRGMMPLMWKSASEEFTDSVRKDNPNRPSSIKNGWSTVVRKLSDPMGIHEAEYTEEIRDQMNSIENLFMGQLGSSISQYGNGNRTKKLGISANSRGVEGILNNVVDNERMGKNLEVISLYFMMAGDRKMHYEREVLPAYHTSLGMMNILHNSRGIKQDNNFKAIKDVINKGLHSSKDDLSVKVPFKPFGAAGDLTPYVQALMNITTFNGLALSLPVAFASGLFNTLDISSTAIANSIARGMSSDKTGLGMAQKAFFGWKSLSRAFRLLGTNSGRKKIGALIPFYQIADSGEWDIVHNPRQLKTQKGRWFQGTYAHHFNWITDYYIRGVALAAQMMHDGTWDAHSLDANNEVVYDPSLDTRDPLIKEAQKKRMLEQGGHGQTENGPLVKAYDDMSAESIKYIGDKYVVGGMDDATKTALDNYTAGSTLLQFKRYLPSRIYNTFGRNIKSVPGGRDVVVENEDGTKMTTWEKNEVEGLVRSWGSALDYAKRVKKTGNFKEEWEAMPYHQRYNIAKTFLNLTYFTLLYAMYNGLTGDDDDDSLLADTRIVQLLKRGGLEAMVWWPTNMIANLESPIPIIENFMNITDIVMGIPQLEFSYKKLLRTVPLGGTVKLFDEYMKFIPANIDLKKDLNN